MATGPISELYTGNPLISRSDLDPVLHTRVDSCCHATKLTKELNMGTEQVPVTFECKKCGGTVVSLPDHPTDASIVSCKSCGTEFGTWGDLKAKALEVVGDKIRSDFKNVFKGLKGWTIE